MPGGLPWPGRAGQRRAGLLRRCRPWILAVLAVLLAPGCLDPAPSRDPAGPAILRFRASPEEIDLGQAITLEAGFRDGAARVDPPGVALDRSGSIQVRPQRTTTYRLTVTDGRGRSAQSSLTAVVRPGLAVRITGHEGVAGEVSVLGPEGYRRTLTASGVLTGLAAGHYQILAAPRERAGQVFLPWQPEQGIHLDTGAEVQVLYPAPTLTLDLPGGVPMEFLLMPGGSFLMGDDAPLDPEFLPAPTPAHPVRIAHAFYFARHPTTRAQWDAVTGDRQENPDRGQEAIDGISYRDIANHFLPALAARFPEHGFRLPSEAEWEYACRAGTSSAFFHGADAARILEHAWSLKDFMEHPHPVGARRPNAWGLHDLFGLVSQWCEDLTHLDYTNAPGDGRPWMDPPARTRVGERIVRGSGPVSGPAHAPEAASAFRQSFSEGYQGAHLGFRLVVATPVLDRPN